MASVDATGTLLELGRQAGLAAVGVCRAEPFTETRVELERRKQQGLHAGMAFTYRRPEIAADPTRSLPDGRSLVVGAVAYRIDDGQRPGPAHGYVARYVHHGLYDQLRQALGVVAVPSAVVTSRLSVRIFNTASTSGASSGRGANSSSAARRRVSWVPSPSSVSRKKRLRAKTCCLASSLS